MIESTPLPKSGGQVARRKLAQFQEGNCSPIVKSTALPTQLVDPDAAAATATVVTPDDMQHATLLDHPEQVSFIFNFLFLFFRQDL
jgi:hypothetical protein